MTEAASLITALLAGFFLGVVFFAGLWWTIRRALFSTHAALWFLCSMLLRSGLMLGGFYLCMPRDWHLF